MKIKVKRILLRISSLLIGHTFLSETIEPSPSEQVSRTGCSTDFANLSGGERQVALRIGLR